METKTGKQIEALCTCVPRRRDIDAIALTASTVPSDLIRAGHSLGCANGAVNLARQFTRATL